MTIEQDMDCQRGYDAADRGEPLADDASAGFEIGWRVYAAGAAILTAGGYTKIGGQWVSADDAQAGIH